MRSALPYQFQTFSEIAQGRDRRRSFFRSLFTFIPMNTIFCVEVVGEAGVQWDGTSPQVWNQYGTLE
jgi:hypothetical protein